jgi:hypothetical protein
MTIPYTFAGATTAIPLANLDANFASPITLGNVAMTLSNTYTSIGNLTLTNVTISSASGIAANTVAYANSSGVLTGSSNLVFNGTNLGIGTSSPTSLLTVNNTGGGTGIKLTGSGTSTQYIDITSTGGDLTLGLDNSAGGLTGYAYGGVIGSYANTALSFVTNAVVRATLDTSGNLLMNTSNAGIRFSNSSALTNSTLNDYETGTWTPNIQFGGGQTGLTYTTQVGSYTKVGNNVTVYGQINIATVGSSGGVAAISNLPFSASGNPYGIGTIAFDQGATSLTSAGFYYGIAASSTLYIRYNNSNGLYQSLSNSNFVSGTQIYFSITYRTSF